MILTPPLTLPTPAAAEALRARSCRGDRRRRRSIPWPRRGLGSRRRSGGTRSGRTFLADSEDRVDDLIDVAALQRIAAGHDQLPRTQAGDLIDGLVCLIRGQLVRSAALRCADGAVAAMEIAGPGELPHDDRMGFEWRHGDTTIGATSGSGDDWDHSNE